MPPVTVMMTVSQRSKQDRGRTEEGRKPVPFGNREKNTEALLNRKRDREKRGKLIVLVHLHCRFYNVHMGGSQLPSKRGERRAAKQTAPTAARPASHNCAQPNWDGHTQTGYGSR